MKPGESEEALLGFDAREMWLTPGLREVGPGGRPSGFLLRTELDDVLSADTMVWPSIFKSTMTTDCGPELPLPAWVGMNVPFWDDLDAIRTAVPRGFGQQHPFWLIAATWHTDVGFPKEETQKGKILGPHLASTMPEQREAGWRFSVLMSQIPGSAGYPIVVTMHLSGTTWPRSGAATLIAIICSKS